MGTLHYLPVSTVQHRAVSACVAGEDCEILLFDGVRYERLDKEASPQRKLVKKQPATARSLIS
jgi:hypothetical protein